MKNQCKDTLLLFHTVPDELSLYLIPDAPDWLSKCHNYLMNECGIPGEIEALLNRLCDALATKVKHCGNPEDPLAAQWSKYKIDLSKVVYLVCEKPIRVVSTGMIL